MSANSKLVIEPTRNADEIRSVLCHPDIYPRIHQDGSSSAEDYQLKMPDSALFLAGYQGDQIIGVMIFDALTPYVYDCHVHVLPDHREHALEFARATFQHLWDHTSAIKITAQIALIYPDVIKFAQKCGFKCEGINVGSYVKHGQIFDQAYMGLQR